MNEEAAPEPKKKPCRNCKEEIDATAKKCPHCQTKSPHVSNAKGCLAFIVICFIIFVIMGVLAPDSEDDKTKKEPAEKANQEQATGIDNPDYIPFEYIDVKEKRDIKMSANVMVELQNGDLPTKANLKATGAHVVNLHEAKNNFVSFFLPGMDLNSTAYAVYTHRKEDEPPSLTIYEFNLPEKYKAKIQK